MQHEECAVDWDSDNQSIDDFFDSVQWREVFANWAFRGKE